MPSKLDIQKKFSSQSHRVKCIDFHPIEPLMLSALYNGTIQIWNNKTEQLIKTFEVTKVPVRSAKFIARKDWIITGSDDNQIRVFNYQTLELINQFEAHSEFIRCIVVHPTEPCVLTSGDDNVIKSWNWSKNWTCTQVYEGHNHYVMQIVINPKDNNIFASVSLDKTIKVWKIGSNTPNYTLEGHEKGLNCIDYYYIDDKSYLISGSDDRTIKIWDCETQTCIKTLEGHEQNVTAVYYHPELSIIITGSEDGTIRLWNSKNYDLEKSFNSELGRVWTFCCLKGSNNVAIGCDEGNIIINLGLDENN